MANGLVAASLALGFSLLFAGSTNAETLKGQTALASYQVPGLCAEGDPSTGRLHLAACARKAPQEFHMETFNDIAQQVSWQKIMRGKDCLQAGSTTGSAQLYTERCAISTWSKSAFWGISSSGDLYSQDKYCPYREDKAGAAGATLTAAECRWFEGPELYPAVIVPSARVGAETLKAYAPGQKISAIIIDNGFSAGNLVASEGAFLTIDKNGKVGVTKGGAIIAGGSGYLIQTALSKSPGAVVLSPPGHAAAKPDDMSPRDLSFFKEKDRGKISYEPR